MKKTESARIAFGILIGALLCSSIAGTTTNASGGSTSVETGGYGHTIVWIGAEDGNVHMYYLGPDDEYGTLDSPYEGEYRLTSGIATREHPKISGDEIIWEDSRNGNIDIYGYHLGPDGIPDTGDDPQEGEHPIVVGPSNSSRPSIFGDTIVYRDDRDGDLQIFMYNILFGKEWRITSNPPSKSQPDIYGDTIVWWDARNGYNDIYMYKLGPDLQPFTNDDPREGEYRVTMAENMECNTRIYGSRIVYQNTSKIEGYNEDIFMYDLGPDGIPFTRDTGEGVYPIAVHPGLQVNPLIYDTKIVWDDFTDGLHLYDIETSNEQKISPPPSPMSLVSFDDNLLIGGPFRTYPDVWIFNLETDVPDGDGIPNYLDPDDDGDGIPDVNDPDPWDPYNFPDFVEYDPAFSRIAYNPPGLGPIRVASIDFGIKGVRTAERMFITVGIENTLSVQTYKAMVHGTLRYEGQVVGTFADLTDRTGEVAFRYPHGQPRLPDGTYTFTVDWISRSECWYLSRMNLESEDSLTL